ncbi:MAG TPA: RNA ligase family protein, partial [Flavisolibacter sp.]|nr:RNA ligase family protein [Flavisolibacter sp.]
MIKRSSIPERKTNNKKHRAEPIRKTTKKNFPIYHVAEKIIRSLPDKQISEIPTGIKPMLATKIDEPFNDKDWVFEVKWDGYRCISYLNNGKADLRSRSNISFNKMYTPVLDALTEWDINAVVDGEIIVVNDQGKSDFEALQKWQQTKEGVLIYYVFDILWLNGIDLTSLPLSQRKDILKKLVPEKSTIKFSDSIEEYGIDFYDIAKSNELEGIVGKKKDSSYEPGKRTSNWLKIPAQV